MRSEKTSGGDQFNPHGSSPPGLDSFRCWEEKQVGERAQETTSGLCCGLNPLLPMSTSGQISRVIRHHLCTKSPLLISPVEG